MSGAHDVIELLSSSDEASSSDSEPRRPPRRQSSSEEEKTQLKPQKRPPARSSHGVRIANGRRRKRVVSSGSESSQESDSEHEEREILEQLNRPRRTPPPKKHKVAATKDYAAPTDRPRHDRRADGEMRQITEGMNFYELQAQQQMMARFQAQNRRKAPRQRDEEPSENPKKTPVGRVAPTDDTAKRSFSDLQAQERATAQYRTQNARKSAPSTLPKKYERGNGSDEDDESEEKDDGWDEFTKKSAQRKQHAADTRLVQKNRELQKAPVSREVRGNHKQKGTRLAARKSALSEWPQKQKVNKRTPVMTPSRSKRREVLKKRSSSSSEEESEKESNVANEAESEAGSEVESEKSGEKSEEDEVVLVEQPVSQQARSLKKKKQTTSKRPNASNDSSNRKSSQSLGAGHTDPDAAQVASRAVHHGVNELQSIAEKMSFDELQAQEQALSFFHAQKKRHTTGASAAVHKGGHNAPSENGTNGTVRARKTNGSGRRSRMGVNQEEAPQSSSSLSFVAPPSRSGFLSSSAPFMSPAKCTAAPAEKPANPVIHSTAWRRLVFAEAQSNILEVVSTIPYSAGSDKPLWDYDPTEKLKEKCKFVAVDEGIAITEDNYALEQLSQKEVDSQVRELVEQELPYIKECHANRVKHILRDTRNQVAGYLKAHQVLRGDLVRRLQWSEISNHQSWLGVSPIERVTAKRVLQHPTHTVRPYNYLVGDVRYLVHRGQTALASLVYPETVIHLSNDITAVRRSFTMIGIRKNYFVENDPILRYVPYLGDGKRMIIDNDLYTETTMSKERQIKVFGEGEELKVLNPSAKDDEIMEYLLRIIVGKCGTSEQVYLALQREAGFDRPRIDYSEMKTRYEAERGTARRIAKVKGLIHSEPVSSTTKTSKAFAQVNVSKVLRKLAQLCWFLRDTPGPQPLAVRLQPPLSDFESNYAKTPGGLGLRNRSTSDGIIEWYRDLFCRRCFLYDCDEHGIQNPQRSHRADPIYPMVTAQGIALARQEMIIEENDLSAEEGSPSSSSRADRAEVIELTGSSSSEDETEEKKNQESSASQPEPGYRRSRRAQTRISSLASNSLQIQEKMQETGRLAELEKRRKRREKFARAADNSEYLDNSYLPSVTTTLKKLLSKTQPCSSSCWLSVGDNEPSEDYAPFSSRVDLVLVRKFASMFGPNACVISAMLKSPRCTCAEISRFLVEEKKRRDSGDNLGADHDPLTSIERRRKPGRHNGGVGSNRSLAKRVRRQGSSDREKKVSYKPCDHDGVCDDRCDCSLLACHKTCSCPRDCPNRFQGCKCSTGNCRTSACPCWNAERECDPDYCFSCGSSDAAVMAFHPDFKSRGSHDLKICSNVNLLRGSIQKKVGVAFSATHGWGAYALEPIRKDEFVLEYTGELIKDDEAERRGAIYDRKSVSYLFGVNSDYVVDAARKGNKAKFANHMAKEEANLDVKIIASNGEHRIGLFAREAIEVGAELFFDYGYTHDTAPKWSQHEQPEPKHKQAYDIVDDENEWEQWE
ncbi:hypothetical protein KRP22_008569 [Phytophthora ramorum]|nr:Histone-lysine N-methyltransferase EZH2 [Phytophthora ramorum]